MAIRTLPLPPGPRTWHPLGALPALRHDMLGWLATVRDAHGDLAWFRAGPMRLALVSHPDLVRDVLLRQDPAIVKGLPLEVAKELLGEGLLTSEGDRHRRQRQAAQPAFRAERAAVHVDATVEETLLYNARWDDGQQIDVQAEMSDLCVSIASRTLLGVRLAPSAARRVSATMDDALHPYQPASLPFARFKLLLPLPSTRRFRQARASLRACVDTAVAQARAGRAEPGSAIVDLLQAHAARGAGPEGTEEALRDELLTLFIASFETTSRALTWAWFLLARHPEAARALEAEVDARLDGRAPTLTDLESLSCARATFAEALRLHPPVFALTRQTLVDTELGGYRIPARTLFVLSPYLLHRDARFFPDPERFDLERWSPAQRAARPAYAYIPFGGGSRRCLGEAVAWAEGTLVLAIVAQRWAISLPAGHVVHPELRIHLQPQGGLPARLARRTSGPCAGRP